MSKCSKFDSKFNFIFKKRPRVSEEYTVKEYLGEGSFAKVYSAVRHGTDETVAIKELKPRSDPLTQLEKLKNEYGIVIKLHHESIIKFMNYVVSDGKDTMCIVMEYCPTNLSDHINRTVMSNQEIRKAMYHLLKGVQYLHSKNIIHRDLKPANLLLSEKGSLKICDFGQAIEATTSSIERNQKSLFGTYCYSAIEVLLESYTKAIDVWSVGCIFACLLKRTRLFRGSNRDEVAKCVFEICGSPKEYDWPGVSELPGMKKSDFPNDCDCILSRKLPENLPSGSFSLLTKLLTYCPDERITAKRALNHTYFTKHKNELRS